MESQAHGSAVVKAEETPFVNRRDPARQLGPDGQPAVSRRAPMWADVPDEKWNDWRWQLSNRVNDLAEIEQILKLTDEEREGLSAPDKFRVDVTPYFISLIDPEGSRRPDPPPDHPARPRAAQLHRDDGGLARRGPPLAGPGPGPPLPRPGPDADHDPVRQLLPVLHPEPDRRRPHPELQPPRARGPARLHPPDAPDPRRADLGRRRPDAGAEAARVRTARPARDPARRDHPDRLAGARCSCRSGSTTSCARCSPSTTRCG